jgi:hypothetical protein
VETRKANVSSKTIVKAAVGRMPIRADLRGMVRRLAYLTTVFGCCGLVCCTIIAFSSPAAAQVPPGSFGTDVALPGNPNPVIGTSNLVIGNQAIGTLNPSNPVTYDGQGGQGFFVTSGSVLTINNSVLQNFITTGGSGSGGGLGAGGAIFIDNGGTAILNNTSFLHNTVIGGTGGTNSPYGGKWYYDSRTAWHPPERRERTQRGSGPPTTSGSSATATATAFPAAVTPTA